MNDDKSNRGERDRSHISGEEAYEVDYGARVLAREFPTKTRQQIEVAVKECAKTPQFHNNRDLVMNCARLKLKNS
jgi:hypothetical protein